MKILKKVIHLIDFRDILFIIGVSLFVLGVYKLSPSIAMICLGCILSSISIALYRKG